MTLLPISHCSQDQWLKHSTCSWLEQVRWQRNLDADMRPCFSRALDVQDASENVFSSCGAHFWQSRDIPAANNFLEWQRVRFFLCSKQRDAMQMYASGVATAVKKAIPKATQWKQTCWLHMWPGHTPIPAQFENVFLQICVFVVFVLSKFSLVLEHSFTKTPEQLQARTQTGELDLFRIRPCLKSQSAQLNSDLFLTRRFLQISFELCVSIEKK